jgi:hypothetical protein
LGQKIISLREAQTKSDSWKAVGRELPFREDLSTEAEE